MGTQEKPWSFLALSRKSWSHFQVRNIKKGKQITLGGKAQNSNPKQPEIECTGSGSSLRRLCTVLLPFPREQEEMGWQHTYLHSKESLDLMAVLDCHQGQKDTGQLPATR